MTTILTPSLYPLGTILEGRFSLFRKISAIFIGTAFIALCAQIQVPFYPVPATMQTFAVLVIGALYGWRLGGITLCAYLFEGVMGLPVFAAPGTGFGLGYVYLVGPTGGYLLGFVMTAMVMGWCIEKLGGYKPVPILIGIILAKITIFVPGVFWLATHIGFDKALQFGLYPFILGDLMKSALVFFTLLGLRPILTRKRLV